MSAQHDCGPRGTETGAATRNTSAIPVLVFQPPECPSCYADLYHDGDGFRCDRCDIEWDSAGSYAEYVNPERPPCGAIGVIELCGIPDKHVACQLDSGHDGTRHSGYDARDYTSVYSTPPTWYRWDSETGKQAWS